LVRVSEFSRTAQSQDEAADVTFIVKGTLVMVAGCTFLTEMPDYVNDQPQAALAQRDSAHD